jgi:1-Cys peroxiredoxin 6
MPYSGALGSSVPIYRGPSTVQTARPLSFGSSYVQPASAYPTTYFTAPQAVAAPARAVGAASATVNNPLRIGATIPNFYVQTTKGDFDLHDFLLGDDAKPWTIMFSHPNDFTPVCTTELGACHSLSGRFAAKGAKLIGISCNTVDSHVAWEADVLHREGRSADGELAFPIVADIDRSLVYSLGMLDPEERDASDVPLPARALVILNGTTVKLTILYPATTGRNFEEIFRVLTSMQLTANNGLATPVNWNYGERVIVGPKVKTEDAKAKFRDFQQEELPSGKPYLRSVADPSKGR